MARNIVVVGGGFAGVWASLAAAHQAIETNSDIEILIINPDGYMTIRPRLYEVQPETLRTPLAPTLEPLGISLLEGRVIRIDPDANTVYVNPSDGGEWAVSYDRLVLAAGSATRKRIVPGLDEFGFSIDTYDDAVRFDRHLAGQFKPNGHTGTDVVVVIGAGFTGLELATEMRNRIAFHHGTDVANKARVLLVDRDEPAGSGLGANPQPHIEEALAAAGIEQFAGQEVASVGPDHLQLSNGVRVDTRTVVNTTGLVASSLTESFSAGRDELGRLCVDEQLRVPGHENVFAAGDVARALADETHPALMSCQHASPMGKIAGYNAARDLMNLPLRAYSQPDYVTCLDLGPAGALFTKGWDRQVVSTGDEAKALKGQIVKEWIYPPVGDRDTMFKASAIDAQPNRRRVAAAE